MCKKFRKAEGANAMVIVAAIGVLVILGLYYLSKDTMKSVAGTQSNMSNAMTEGLNELRK